MELISFDVMVLTLHLICIEPSFILADLGSGTLLQSDLANSWLDNCGIGLCGAVAGRLLLNEQFPMH